MTEEVVTFDEVPGYRSRRELGYVTGSASRQRNLLRSTFRSLGLLLGLATLDSLSEADELRGEALCEMRRRAGEMGANAVVGVRFTVNEEQGMWSVTAAGRALELEPTA